MDDQPNSSEDRVILKKNIGFFSGVSFIITVILGTGIFISPGAVLVFSQLNVGVSLVIWAACGIISMAGALCYAELGTTFPSSGGEYFYIKRSLGPLPAFFFLWTFIVFLRPAVTTVQALMFAEYVIQPFFPGCPSPEAIKKALAMAVILAVGILNCFSTRWIIFVQNIFTLLKIVALVGIVVSGIIHLAMGKTSNFQRAFEGDVPNVSQVGEAFYQGMFAFGGWNVLNYVIGENHSAVVSSRNETHPDKPLEIQRMSHEELVKEKSIEKVENGSMKPESVYRKRYNTNRHSCGRRIRGGRIMMNRQQNVFLKCKQCRTFF